MNNVRSSLFAALLALSLGACRKSEPVDQSANAVAPVSVTRNDDGPAAGGPPPTLGAAPAIGNGRIPAALQGRWGLTPADCEPGRSDAKGLLIVAGDKLTFYESRAVPGVSVEADDRSISGEWNFTGEGQSWSKYVSLKLDGPRLVRTERDPVASYNYAKCD